MEWEKETYYLTMLVALTMPWGFVQANRLWDPSFVPFYFSLFFWAFSAVCNDEFKKTVMKYIIASIAMGALVLLAVVYPPCRIPAVALWIFSFIYLIIRKADVKLLICVIAVSVFLAIPLAYNILFNPEFNSRSSRLFIFGKDDGFLKELFSYLKNVADNFSPEYLFVTGDVIDRHSLPIFGVLGTFAIIPLIKQIRHKMELAEIMAWYTIIWSAISTSLTDEYQPHTLRNCLSWPAYAILIARGCFLLMKDGKGENVATRTKVVYGMIALQFVIVFLLYILYYKQKLGFLFE